MSPDAAIGQEHADLTILDAAGSAGVLPLYANRFRALLQEARFIDDQHGFRIAELLDNVIAQIVTHGLGVPLAAGNEVLQINGCGITQLLRQLPTILPLDAADQPS